MIAGALARAKTGNGSVIAIEGEPGIGKSALLRSAAERATAEAMSCHLVRGSETERHFGDELIRSLAEHMLRRVEDAEREQLQTGPAADLSVLFDPASVPAAELTIVRSFQALVENCAAERQLFLAIDDVHWADARSLRVLLYLAHRIRELPAVLCLASRPAAGDDMTTQLVDGLLSEAEGLVLHPRKLSLCATSDLIATTLGDEAEPNFCAACHQATGGNPLLLRELMRGLATGAVSPVDANTPAVLEVGGPAASRTVRLRLSRLPEAATTLTRAAAVLGEKASIADVAEVAGLDAATAFEATGHLGQVEILNGGAEVGFVHPLIREGVLAEMSNAEAAALHEAAAKLLARSGASPQKVARHLLHVRPQGSPETVDTLGEAASIALATGEIPTAVELLKRALDEPPPVELRPALMLQLAIAENHVDHDAASSHAEAALQLIDEPREQAIAAARLAEMLPVVDPHRAIEVLMPQIENLPDCEVIGARVTMLVAALLKPDTLGLARELAELLRPEVNAQTIEARMAASLVGYFDALDNRSAEEVAAMIELTALPLEPPNVLGPLCLAMMALNAADSPATLTIADEWTRLAERTGLAGNATGAMMARSHALLAHGRLTEAVVEARHGIEVAELYVGGASTSWIASALIESLIELGDLDEAEAALRRYSPGSDPEWTFDLHGLLLCRVRLEVARGRGSGALGRALELGRLCEEAGVQNPALCPWRSRAALLLGAASGGSRSGAARSDDKERARQLAAEEVELARAWGAPTALGRSLSALATVCEGDEAVELHEEAVATLEASPSAVERARGQLAFGATLRRLGRRAASRDPLRRAAALAEDCGAAPLRDRARAELVAAGARPRRTSLSGRDSLTPRELEITTLAAQGQSNAEIAETLFLTVRTVESHLSNAYRKLEVSSRTQLPQAMGE